MSKKKTTAKRLTTPKATGKTIYKKLPRFNNPDDKKACVSAAKVIDKDLAETGKSAREQAAALAKQDAEQLQQIKEENENSARNARMKARFGSNCCAEIYSGSDGKSPKFRPKGR